MAQAAEQHYRGKGSSSAIAGFVTTRHGSRLPTDQLEIVEAGHPVPDAGSVAAAARRSRWRATAGPDDLVLVLLSGGASALWSAPVEGVTLRRQAGS